MPPKKKVTDEGTASELQTLSMRITQLELRDEAWIGSSLDWDGAIADIPDGFLLEDGRVVSRIIYRKLFAKIGTTYGVGDGVNSFNIPDSRNKYTVGAGDAYDPADTFGADSSAHIHTTGDHTLIIAELATHTHIQNAHSHGHNFSDVLLAAGGVYRQDTAVPGTIFYGIIESTTATNQNTGSDAAHNHGNTGTSSVTDNRPQSIAKPKMVYTGVFGL